MHGTTDRLPPAAAGLLTFVATACVLVLEIAAARLLAPYVGVSLTTYTAIIGVILAGIALGAWVGGRLADRLPARRLLGPAFVLGGVAAMAAVPAVGAVGALGLGSSPPATVVLAGVGFVVPAAILSAVAPILVRASLVDLATSGSLVGRLSALGTLGAISGTYLTGFVLLGLVPTRWLILGTGALLAALGVLLAATDRRSGGGGLAVVALVGTVGLAGGSAAAPDPCPRESAYFCMAVVRDDGGPGRTLVLDRVRHAHVNPEDPTELEFRYVRWFADATADLVASRPSLSVVHLGGGGFTFPRYLSAVAPDSRHLVLEIDPEVVAVAEEELGLVRSANLQVRVGDARLGIRGVPTDSADLVVGDAFASLSVPWHLTTHEFLAEIDRVLRPGGRYVMNLIDGPGLRFARAEAATLRTVWRHVAVIAPSAALEGRGGANVVLLASDEPLDAAAIRGRMAARGDSATPVMTARDELDRFVAGAPVLTDDFAPVDQLLLR